ncbi:MAG: glucokinase [Hyphomicrobiaceae bacterium]
MTRQALVADIGGTHARFALADPASGRLSAPQTFDTGAFATIEAAIRSYLVIAREPEIGAAAIAMAGPVEAGHVTLTNGRWSFKPETLQQALGLARLAVLNDFEALALSLPEIDTADLVQLGGRPARPDGVRIVLGPGTGFGGATLVPGRPPRVLPGEIGHISLPIRGLEEARIAEGLADADGHIPVENAISGPGLAAIYRQCTKRAPRAGGAPEPADIVERARTGADPIAVESVGHFITWLGRVAGNAAMLLRADGGIYIGGGIAPRMLDLLADGRFRHAFESMGRMSGLVRPIPVFVITAEAPALLGAAARLRSAMPE